MEWQDILKIVTTLLVSLGGAGAIILAFSKFIGELFAKKIKASFQKEINTYQSQLDILKQTTLRYSDKQFELYSILWSNLHDLKVLAEDLWIQANPRRLEKFVAQLRKTKSEIEKASLFIEDTHYERLIDTLKQFGEYQFGKKELIEYRKHDDYFVSQMITQNGQLKNDYETLISEVKTDLKKQLKGESPVATMYIQHKWLSGLRSICTFNQLRQICDLTVCFKTVSLCLIANLAQCKLTGNCFEITYVSYTNRCQQFRCNSVIRKLIQ